MNPRSEYPVRVRPLGLEYDASIADLYAGAYEVALNYMVDITFVPDLGPDARPYERSRLPENPDDVSTPEEARLEALLYADCAVTPNARLAGTHEPLPKPPWALEDPPGVVVYVTHEEFEYLTADLELLAPDHSDLYSDVTISQLRGRPAIAYVERLVWSPLLESLASYWLRDED